MIWASKMSQIRNTRALSTALLGSHAGASTSYVDDACAIKAVLTSIPDLSLWSMTIGDV